MFFSHYHVVIAILKSQPNSFGVPSAHSVRSGILPREDTATIGSEQPTEPMLCVASDCFLRRLLVVPLTWAQLEARTGGKTGLEGGRGKRGHEGRMEGTYPRFSCLLAMRLGMVVGEWSSLGRHTCVLAVLDRNCYCAQLYVTLFPHVCMEKK